MLPAKYLLNLFLQLHDHLQSTFSTYVTNIYLTCCYKGISTETFVPIPCLLSILYLPFSIMVLSFIPSKPSVFLLLCSFKSKPFPLSVIVKHSSLFFFCKLHTILVAFACRAILVSASWYILKIATEIAGENLSSGT